jgi:DNA (cytosine-5)-methyltransferase 1
MKARMGGGRTAVTSLSVLARADLLPTPSVADGTGGHRSRGGARSDEPLLGGIADLLPTPRHRDGRGCRPGAGAEGGVDLWTAAQPSRWGRYAAAIHRWERVTGRSAPEPTVRAAPTMLRMHMVAAAEGCDGWAARELIRGGWRCATLNPRLSEWMMGLPDGWLQVRNVSASAQKAAAGNGVVVQQGAMALRLLLGLEAG